MKNKLLFHFTITFRHNKNDILLSYLPLSADTLYKINYIEMGDACADFPSNPVTSFYETKVKGFQEVLRDDIILAENIKEGYVPIGCPEDVTKWNITSLREVSAFKIALALDGALGDYCIKEYKQRFNHSNASVDVEVTWDTETGKIETHVEEASYVFENESSEE